MKDVAALIYEMITDTDDGTPLTDTKIDEFIKKLTNDLYKEYPHFK